MPKPLLLAMLCAAALGAAEPSLLSNGDCELDADTDGKPDGWPMPAGVTWEAEDGNHFLRLKASESGKQLVLYRQVPVAGAQAIRVSFRVRHAEVKRGRESWHDARVIIDCKDAAGKTLQPAPAHPFFSGTSAGWLEKSISFIVPSGTAVISFMPALFQVESGSLDIDDVVMAATGSAAPAKP